jgi:hypothetical protein
VEKKERRAQVKKKRIFGIFLVCLFLFVSSFLTGQRQEEELTDEQKILQTAHSISSHELFHYVKVLASDKYEGRLTGTEAYNASAQWVTSHFEKWGVTPVGDKDDYFQSFPNPYTLVFEDCEVSLHLPVKDGTVKKYYHYFDEFIPGSTSGSGEVTAEVIYVGYGATAPELDYDDYEGVDVRDKIVLMEREVPVSPRDDEELFKKWRPYSFHQYKLENAVKHGAKGMIYNYGPIGNPNNAYDAGFIYSHVGDVVTNDVFAGTGYEHAKVVEKIRETLKPHSFATGKVVTVRNTTEHHPDGIGINVVGLIVGSDPDLKDEIIAIGGHLDHLGKCYTIMPGANDNASAVAVMMGMAKAFHECPIKPRRSILFLGFGAEEQAVAGSDYYCENPIFPLEKTVCLLNMDGVGSGDKISARAAENFPELWEFIKNANEAYIHRIIRPSYFANIARPRLDAARFMWKGVPTISFGVFPSRSEYHNPNDNIAAITPEILEDMTQLLFLAVLDMANQDSLDFRK